MIENNEYKIGSIVEFKKSHPSGTTEWEVIRLGADIKVQSKIKKDLYIMVSRKKFNKIVKNVLIY